jgi:hypothetical protein
VKRIVTVALVAIGLLACAPPAGAEHTVYYRYVVLGFVKDARGKPVGGHSVKVVRDKTGLIYPGATDEQGFFVVVVRLGDESAGETLTLGVGKAATTITARFDPVNHSDDRGTRVDLEGTKFVERTAGFRPTLARFLGSGTH